MALSLTDVAIATLAIWAVADPQGLGEALAAIVNSYNAARNH